MHKTCRFLFFFLVFFVPAQNSAPCQEAKPEKIASLQTVKTSHTIRIDGKVLQYQAIAGDIQITNKKAKPVASIFYCAYLKDQAQNTASRPLTFIFNGGPGASAIWLHLGALGPKRIRVDDDGYPDGPPFGVTDNTNSLLDVSDLVFIDPVSTGFSRALEGEDPGQFHKVESDIESIAQFVQHFLNQYMRWDSPIFIIGESYGAARAAGLVDFLQRRHRLYASGVALLAPAINYRTFFYNRGNDLPYVLALPTFTATAWYHGKLAPDLQTDFQKTLNEVQSFALKEYAWALIMGSSLPVNKRKEIVRQLARFTGLQEKEFDEADLRINSFTFASKLLGEKHLQVGVLDSRFVGYSNSMPAVPMAPNYSYVTRDPFLPRVDGAFTSAFNHYVRNELQYKTALTYEPLLSAVARSWKYDVATNNYLYMADNLRTAMTQNPRMKVFVAAGYYDLVTTHFATEYIVNHIGISPTLRSNIALEFYEAGHMMYLHPASLLKMKNHLTDFYKSAIQG